MFDWLREELAAIAWRRFHVVDGPANADLRKLVEVSDLPASHRAFVIEFGGAKLYQQHAGYQLSVLRSPREVVASRDGEPLLWIGHGHCGLAYFKSSELGGESEPMVYEPRAKSLASRGSFEQWLSSSAATARRKYPRKRWAELHAGPPPFTAVELEVVEARRQFAWSTIGTSPGGHVRFQVHNGSTRTLPFLTIGVRSASRNFEGAVWLSVSSLQPGQSTIIEKDCYLKLATPDQVEIFPLPTPEPEDRERYWEFRSLPTASESDAQPVVPAGAPEAARR